jgi:protocadherin Fat 1/2/3
VNARDRDSGDNARISYSIANIDADDIPFEIDHFSGVVKSRKVIDYESDRREYKLIIRDIWRHWNRVP